MVICDLVTKPTNHHGKFELQQRLATPATQTVDTQVFSGVCQQNYLMS